MSPPTDQRRAERMTLGKIVSIVTLAVMLAGAIGGYFVLRSDVENLKATVSTDAIREFAILQIKVKHLEEKLGALTVSTNHSIVALHKRISQK